MPIFLSKTSPFSFVFSSSFSLPSRCAFLLSTLSFHASCYPSPDSSRAFFLLSYVPSLPSCVEPFWNNSPINCFSSRFPFHLATQKHFIPNPLWPPKTAHPWGGKKNGKPSLEGFYIMLNKNKILKKINYLIFNSIKN